MPKKLRRDTRVFISAVSKELGTVRVAVKKALEDNDCHAVEQQNFPPDYRELIEKLRLLIDSCDAVIHIAGRCSGGEPQHRPEGAPRRSYTQLEHDLAREMGKPVYVFITDDVFPVDPHEPEDPDRMQLQREHRERLTSSDREYVPVSSRDQLDEFVRRIRLRVEVFQDELTRVDEKLVVTGRKLGRRLAAISVGVLLLLAGVGYAVWQGERSRRDARNIANIEKTIAERFLNNLLTDKGMRPEEARQEALEELPSLVDLPLETIQRLIDGRIAPRAKDASLTPLERARAALTVGDYAAVTAEAEQQRETTRELAMLEGTAYLARFREDPRPEWNERAVTAFRQAYELTDPKIAPLARAEAAIAAAFVLHCLARYTEAEPLMREALSLWENVLAPDHPSIALALNDLAQLFQTTNRHAEAEPLMRRALKIDEDSYGPHHPKVAIRLSNLALLLNTTNRHSEAEPLMRRALTIDEQCYGPDHPNLAIRLNNLAQLFKATNRLAEAEPFMRRALKIDEDSYGPNHPHVAVSLNNLAQWLKATNRLTEAEPLMRRALAIDEQSYGPDHPDVGTDLNNLANLLATTNRLAEAEPLMRRALMIDEQCYGPDHPNLAIRLNNLAQLFADTNRHSEAEPLMRRALAIDERSYGPDHPDVAICLNNLALLLKATNRLAEAEPLYRRALAIDEKSYGPDHPNVGIRLNNLAQVLQATNRLTEAEPPMRRVVEIFEKSYGLTHPNVATALSNLAQLLQATNRVTEAEPLIHRALTIDEESYGPDHPNVAIRLSNLAALLTHTNRHSEAEPLMRRAVEIYHGFDRNTGHEHPRMKAALVNYLALLEGMKLSEEEIAERMQELMP